MKKFLFVLIFLVYIPLIAQDVNVNVSAKFYRDTLTTTKDTIDVNLLYPERFNRRTITALTTTDTDTINIYTKSWDNQLWIQQGLIDLSDNSNKTNIIITTISKEFLINDPEPYRIRLIAVGVSTSCIIIVTGKYVR